MKSAHKSAQNEKETFSEVETYCTFVGHHRSGHSLVGSLLDAHPDAVVAHQLHALKHIQAGCGKHELFQMLLDNSRKSADGGRIETGYAYAVPGQWNGQYRHLKMIGDKKGRDTSYLVGEDPQILEKLVRVVGVRCKFLQVIRNPYDNISTIAFRDQSSLEQGMAVYFTLWKHVETARALTPPEHWFTLYHEDLVANPKAVLERLCAFLNLEPYRDYLASCASIVYDKPHRSRLNASWTPELIQSIAEKMKAHQQLAKYTFQP